jgi:hemolysin III
MSLPASHPVFAHRGYSAAERVADAAVHAAAIVAGMIAFPFLFWRVATHGRFGDGVAMTAYAAGFFLLFGFSCAYNFVKPSPAKWCLRRFDHAAIFLMIAGTYTALLSQVPASTAAVGLELFVWAAALAGAAIKIALPGRFERGTILIYLALGWAALPMAPPLAASLPPATCALVVAGGALYSIGVAFHVWESLKFQSAIWHGFVAAAAGCQFAGVMAAVGR